MTSPNELPGVDRATSATGDRNAEIRLRNRRTGLTLAAIAAGFFIAVILRHIYFH